MDIEVEVERHYKVRFSEEEIRTLRRMRNEWGKLFNELQEADPQGPIQADIVEGMALVEQIVSQFTDASIVLRKPDQVPDTGAWTNDTAGAVPMPVQTEGLVHRGLVSGREHIGSGQSLVGDWIERE